MKRFFALLLVVLMLLPSIVACGEERDPTESSTPESTAPSTTPSSMPAPTTTPSSKPSSTGSSTGGSTTDSTTGSSSTGTAGSSTTGSSSTGGSNVVIDPTPIDPDLEGPTVNETWTGETINILATIWGDNPEPGYPWSQAELTVTSNDQYNSNDGFGQLINKAILDRAAFIKNTYGVTLNWINARSAQIATVISDAVVGGSASTQYHIAMPRMLEAQAIVGTQSIYDLANRRYIDLTKSYYSQASIDAYTAKGHTLFVAGDFSFLDEQTAYLMYYNVAMTERDGLKESFPDLYNMVKEGRWTIAELTNVAKLVGKDNGEPGWKDTEDEYGFGTTALVRFFQYSGIQQVEVKDGSYVVTMVPGDSRIGTLIDQLIAITKAEWARTSWEGGYGALQNAFSEGRLLFYNEVVQKTDSYLNQTDSFKVGVLPTPKLNVEQPAYYTPCANQAVLMCIPKSTTNREMSDYFFEVLSYTGKAYVMKAYLLNLKTKLYAETATQSMDIIENYIFNNLCYDVGYMHDWNGLLTSVQNEAFSTGTNNFSTVYSGSIEQANKTIGSWNMNWLDYTDEIYLD